MCCAIFRVKKWVKQMKYCRSYERSVWWSWLVFNFLTHPDWSQDDQDFHRSPRNIPWGSSAVVLLPLLFTPDRGTYVHWSTWPTTGALPSEYPCWRSSRSHRLLVDQAWWTSTSQQRAAQGPTSMGHDCCSVLQYGKFSTWWHYQSVGSAGQHSLRERVS